MEIVTIHTANTTLSQLIARVEAGEEILLTRGNQPIAKTGATPAEREYAQVWRVERVSRLW
jgi:antitoxin (DNA-binding transcriptional repressor) of toxin-antitoxin stability system